MHRDMEAKRWWAATVLPRVLRFKRPLHHLINACSPARMDCWINGKEQPLDIGAVRQSNNPSLHHSNLEWSQSPVLPWTQRAYETCLSAGSTAMLGAKCASTVKSAAATRTVRIASG